MFLMKKIIILSLLFVISHVGAFAQNDAAYSAKIKRMFEVSGSEQIFKTSIKSMFDIIKKQKSQVPEDVLKEYESQFLNTSLDDLVKMFVPIYQKYLTGEEVDQLIAFYQSPIGKKFAGVTPAITQESMLAGQQWGMQVFQNIQTKLKEKGY